MRRPSILQVHTWKKKAGSPENHPLKKEIIWTKPPLLGSMLIIGDVLINQRIVPVVQSVFFHWTFFSLDQPWFFLKSCPTKKNSPNKGTHDATKRTPVFLFDKGCRDSRVPPFEQKTYISVFFPIFFSRVMRFFVLPLVRGRVQGETKQCLPVDDRPMNPLRRRVAAGRGGWLPKLPGSALGWIWSAGPRAPLKSPKSDHPEYVKLGEVLSGRCTCWFERRMLIEIILLTMNIVYVVFIS